MNLMRALRMCGWVLIISVAVMGVPLIPVMMNKRDDPEPVKIELVETARSDDSESSEDFENFIK